METPAPRVLIVEDDDAVRGFLGRALERGGWTAVGVRTGEEAMATLHAVPGIALVLIDGLLPDMHGVRLAEALLDDPQVPGIALCFISGAIREHHQPSCGVGALSKPVRLRAVLDMVQQLLAWHDGEPEDAAQRQAALRALQQTFLVGP